MPLLTRCLFAFALLSVEFSTLAAEPNPVDMVWIAGGTFTMGSDLPGSKRNEQPEHKVLIDGFWIDEHAVTNADAPAGVLVFVPSRGPVYLRNMNAWWRWVKGANWQHPEGPGSDVSGRENHPVVQVSWDDAVAYAKWAESACLPRRNGNSLQRAHSRANDTPGAMS